MCKKFFIMALLLAVFIAMPLTSMASTISSSNNFEDLEFKGEFQFDLNGFYYIGPIKYPLNVLGSLDVSNGDSTLGKLSINAQKDLVNKTYFGHWMFLPSGYECGCCGFDYKLGMLTDFKIQDSGEIGFTLEGFNEGEQLDLTGLWDEGSFSSSTVPIPGALLLFGSGLLSLICIRKK